MSVCPTCGQAWMRLESRPECVLGLLGADLRRHVYKGRDGRWFVNYGGGEVAAEAVEFLIKRGDIQRTYDMLDEDYHIGKTIDTKATADARKSGRISKATLIYTDGTQGPCNT